MTQNQSWSHDLCSPASCANYVRLQLVTIIGHGWLFFKSLEVDTYKLRLLGEVATCDFWPMKQTNSEVKPTDPSLPGEYLLRWTGFHGYILGVQSYLQTPGVWKPRKIVLLISPHQKFANLNKRHGDDMKGQQNYMPAELLFPTTTHGITQQNITQTTTTITTTTRRRNFYSFVPCSRWEHVW